MSIASALRIDYAILEMSRPEAGNLSTKPVEGADTPFGPAWLAVDAEGQRHLLIPVPKGATLTADRRSSGIHVGPHELLKGGERLTFLDICCRKPYLHDVFLRVAEEMLEEIGRDVAPPDHVAITVLNRWRDLLSRARGDGPSQEQLTGLYAELLHLCDICLINPSGLRTWHGPDHAIHDFAAAGIHLEVKASTSRQGWRCTVHGLEQLDCPPGSLLFFSMAQVEIGGAEGDRIPEIVEMLLSMGVDAPLLFSRLDAAGLPVGHLSDTEDLVFRLVERRIWRVEDSFPRLTPSSLMGGVLPPGVATVNYQLDLTAHATPSLGEDEVKKLHTQLAEDPE